MLPAMYYVDSLPILVASSSLTHAAVVVRPGGILLCAHRAAVPARAMKVGGGHPVTDDIMSLFTVCSPNSSPIPTITSLRSSSG